MNFSFGNFKRCQSVELQGTWLIIDKFLRREVEVRRIRDRIMLLKLVVGEETINIIVHASQIGLEESVN